MLWIKIRKNAIILETGESMKIGIIGIGSVGGAIASRIVADKLANELVLIDRDSKRIRAAALDLSHAAAFGRGIKITAGNYRNLRDADVVIISAGANQKVGESRTDLVEKNAAVMLDVVPRIMEARKPPIFRRAGDSSRGDNLILIVVSNPLDSMVMAVKKLSRLPASRVIGTGTMLDSARLRAELAARFDVAPANISAYVLGEHGDSSVINWAGANIGEFAKPLAPKARKEIEARVRGAAYEIIQGRGATWDGIAAAAADLLRCIKNDERRALPVSIADGAAHSLPRIVGRGGVVRTLSPKMDDAERKALAASIRAIQKTYKIIE
jgi:L-lactate dehydrogenase